MPSLSNTPVGPSRPNHAPAPRARRRRDENSLRVTNLSDDVTEADLQELFRPFGHVSRVFVAVDRATGENRGFAFVNYVHRCVRARACGGLGCWAVCSTCVPTCAYARAPTAPGCQHGPQRSGIFRSAAAPQRPRLCSEAAPAASHRKCSPPKKMQPPQKNAAPHAPAD